ncbi:hypothetical protein PPYR_15094 [Photinus pyralis]|uniref:Retrotransposon gag domain-containing protein n=1 Tax=Photinus pyralis TaxID=7054 RepID=A0A5N3ZZR0_PHOPY|nr:hypothetical protein PPYR_15094 [Photinus pyralis]
MELYKIPNNLSLQGNLAENWRKFKQSFKIFMKATGKDAKDGETKVAIFLNIIGEEAVEVFNTMFISDDDRKDIDKVIEAFEGYCLPKTNVVYERFVFHKRNQCEGESFEQFLTDLTKLASTCDFKTLNEEMIRDRVVLGVQDLNLQEKLLRTEGLTLQKTVEICKAFEITKEQMKQIKDPQLRSVNKIANKKPMEKTGNTSNQSSNRKEEFKCKRCQRTHGPRECPAYGVRCRLCGNLIAFSAE